MFPGENSSRFISIPLMPLGKFGRIGYDRKQIHSNTEDGRGQWEIMTFWGRDNRKINRILVDPTGYRNYKSGKSKTIFQQLVSSASHLLIPETVWLPKSKFLCLYCSEKVISNVFWSFSAKNPLLTANGEEIQDFEFEKIQALWGNTTLGILLLLGMSPRNTRRVDPLEETFPRGFIIP